MCLRVCVCECMYIRPLACIRRLPTLYRNKTRVCVCIYICLCVCVSIPYICFLYVLILLYIFIKMIISLSVRSNFLGNYISFKNWCTLKRVRFARLNTDLMIAIRLSTFTTDTSGQLNVLGHDGDTFSVDGAQVGIFEKTD